MEKVVKVKDQAEAIRAFNYPFVAVEEVLASSVCHHDYRRREPITVRITREGMEITSFPRFERSISNEDVKEGKSFGKFYRSRRIGDFLNVIFSHYFTKK